VALGEVAEARVLSARAWNDSKEPSATLRDAAHVLVRAELEVGHVSEARSFHEGKERVPGLDVGSVVGRVPVGTSIDDRHRAIGTDRQDEQQLLEIGAAIFVVSVRNRRGELASSFNSHGAVVVIVEGNGRQIDMEARRVQVELANHSHQELGKQTRAVAVQAPIERATHPIIVQRTNVTSFQPSWSDS